MFDHGALILSGTSIVISVGTAYLSLHERFKRLRVTFAASETVRVTPTKLEASVLIFNPSSRSNCIQAVHLVLDDRSYKADIFSGFTKITLDGETAFFNTVPLDIAAGSGVVMNLYSEQYALTMFKKYCYLHVTLVDVFNHEYKIVRAFTNRWGQD